MNHCTECFARLDGCQECMDAELAAKDKEIESLKAKIESLKETIILQNSVLDSCL